MGHDSPRQPPRPSQTLSATGEIDFKLNGKHVQCNGAECPWMKKDTEQRSEDMKKLSRAVLFCVTFMLIEVVGGIRAGSLAILTDASHLLSDVASFAISLFAMWAGGWEANLRQTYGFFRLEILGALVSIQIIWLLTGIIVYEAFVRLFRDPVDIDGRLMFIIASLGLVVNLLMMFLLGHGHDHGHDHGHSHGASNKRAIEHKHTKQHKHREDVHDHDEYSLQQPLLADQPSHHHHHGQEHSHDHHDNDGYARANTVQGEKHSHHHHDDEQDHDDHGSGHQGRGDDVHCESNDVPSSTDDGTDESAAIGLRQDGHKTECVEKNRTKRSRSNDTIIMCICDELERRSENDRSVRVTIDHGGNHDDHDGSTHESSINVRGAYLHVLGDLIQSIGVMVGGAVIWYKPEWRIVDLLCTFFFSIIVLGTTIKMIRDILEVLMESTPREVDAEALQSGLMAIDGVIEVHELHIWAITVGKVVLACHVMIRPDADPDDLLEKVIQYCDQKYKISHVTIQIERLKE